MVLYARVVVAGGAALAATVFAVFGAPFSAVLLVLVAVQAGLGRWGIAAVPFALALPGLVVEAPIRSEQLANILTDEGPGALNDRDLASIWLLHLGVVLGGATGGFGEAARETAGLVVRGPETRVRESSFPTGAEPVRGVVDRWIEVLRGSMDDGIVFRARSVPIPRAPGQLRYQLALDPITLSGTAVRIGGRWRLNVVGRVSVDYPASAELEMRVTPVGPVLIHEGLFDVLEQRGWLFPYTAEWRWTEWIEDPL